METFNTMVFSSHVDGKTQLEIGKSVVDHETTKVVKAPAMKDWMPHYLDSQKKVLEQIKQVVNEEKLGVMTDAKFHAIAYPSENNCLIPLHLVAKEGKEFATPAANAEHGKDQVTTGDSLMSHGAQHVLIVITAKIARAAGLEITRFSTDPQKGKPIPDDALVVIDGNGRVAYLLTIPVDQWPEIYGIFPMADRAGYYDLPNIITTINTKVRTWKTENFVGKRIIEEGEKTHEGWQYINVLLKRGYKYQAACGWATFRNDRITKKEVTEGNSDVIFRHFKSAKAIHEALVKKFGDGTDNTLKTKAFGIKVKELWEQLQTDNGDAKATELFIEFVETIPEDKVEEIKFAKAKKTSDGSISKDEIRCGILDSRFTYFLGQKNITL